MSSILIWLVFLYMFCGHLIRSRSANMINCSFDDAGSCCKTCVAPQVFCESGANCSVKVLIHSPYPNRIAFTLMAKFDENFVIPEVKLIDNSTNNTVSDQDEDYEDEPTSSSRNGTSAATTQPSTRSANQTEMVVVVKKNQDASDDQTKNNHKNGTSSEKPTNQTAKELADESIDESIGNQTSNRPVSHDLVMEAAGIYVLLTIPIAANDSASIRLYCKYFKDGAIKATGKFLEKPKENQSTCTADLDLIKTSKKKRKEGHSSCRFTLPLRHTLLIQRTNKETNDVNNNISFDLTSKQMSKVSLELGNMFLVNGRYESHARKGNKFTFRMDLDQLPADLEDDGGCGQNTTSTISCQKSFISGREKSSTKEKKKGANEFVFNWLHMLLIVVVITLLVLLVMKFNQKSDRPQSF